MLFRLKRLEPDDPDAGLECASAALSFGRVSEALRILAGASATTRSKARYYHLLSVARFMSGALPAADAACKEALRLEPGNKVYLANQATIELSSPSETMRQAALDRLADLTGNEQTALTALQSLLRFAAKSAQEPAHFDRWLQAFQRYVQPRDYLFTLRLDALHRRRPEDFRRELAIYLESASRDFESAAAAAGWLAEHQLSAEALSFRDSVPADWQNKMEFLAPAVRACFDLGRTQNLEALLQGEPGNLEILPGG